MAQRARSFAENAPGPFFVDDTCIDCGTCYTLAPEVFRDAGGHSLVHRQPADATGRRRASMAVLACPTASIGTEDKSEIAGATASFPTPIEDEVGFWHDRESGYGGRRPL